VTGELREGPRAGDRDGGTHEEEDAEGRVCVVRAPRDEANDLEDQVPKPPEAVAGVGTGRGRCAAFLRCGAHLGYTGFKRRAGSLLGAFG
jgi:hypothetical protein